MSDVPAHEHNPRGEWRKFSILVIILVGVILVVALLRPLIFGRIVPAILGENLPPTAEVIEANDSSDVESPESNDLDSSTEIENDEAMDEDSEDLSEEEESSIDQNAQDENASEEEGAENNPGAETEQKTHIVQSGETLLQIARQYEVTTADLISANNIANPNVVRIGEELIIPTQ